MTFVAQVRQVNRLQTNIHFKVDDGTGVIEGKKFIDADKSDEGPEYTIQTDDYVRVYGHIRSFNNNRHIAIQVIRPITDYNEIHYHLLEATAVHLYYTKGQLGQQGGGGAAANPAGGDSMFVDDGGYGGGAGGDANQHAAGAAKLGNVSAPARRLYDFMLNAPGGNEGVHLQELSKGLGMTAREVLAAADELLGQGVIYTTIDDETWAVLEY